MNHYTIRTDLNPLELSEYISKSDKKIEFDAKLNKFRGKQSSLFLGRNSQFGDIVVYLPFLNYVEKVFPNSYKIYSLAKKCSQFAPFLLNHPLIDKIEITAEKEGWSDKDTKLAQQCDLVFNINPPITDQYYFNNHNILVESFIMNQLWCNNSWLRCVGINEWNSLSAQEQKPSLYQWFDVDKKNKTIGILPFAGYGQSITKSRSPSIEWWNKMIDLLKLDYKIIHFGHPSNPKLENTTNLTHLNLFDTAKELLGCDLVLGSDSGLQWAVGAYGHPQIVLYTNYIVNHFQNYDAFLPVNNKNNLASFLGVDNIDIINQEEVLVKIKEVLN